MEDFGAEWIEKLVVATITFFFAPTRCEASAFVEALARGIRQTYCADTWRHLEVFAGEEYCDVVIQLGRIEPRVEDDVFETALLNCGNVFPRFQVVYAAADQQVRGVV